MAELRSVYLVYGDDDTKIDAWRARLRRRAEDEGGPGALETYDAGTSSPEEVAAGLATLTFAAGDRYLLADRIDAWKPGSIEPLERALADPPPGTVLVLIARGKAPAGLAKAVERAGGEVREYAAPRPAQMPRWAAERAQEHGLHLDAEAAKALVALAGPRQQRIAREIEKLALMVHPRTNLGAEEVERMATGDASPQAYDLADALVAGDAAATMAIAEDLKVHDDRPGRLIYPLMRRLRDLHRAAELLDAGVPEPKVAATLKMPPWAAKRAVAQARKADRESLERALCALADLEVELRGGGELDEDTAFSLALARAAG